MTSPIIDIGTMLTNLQNAFSSLEALITAFSYVAGVFFIAQGIFKLKALAESVNQTSQPGELFGPIVELGVGALLLYLPSTIDMGLNTLFASTSLGTASELFSYLPTSGTINWQQILNVLVKYLQLLGLIAFIRGWIMLTKIGHNQQPGHFSKGVIHIISGILLINIVDTLNLLANTFGFVGFSS